MKISSPAESLSAAEALSLFRPFLPRHMCSLCLHHWQYLLSDSKVIAPPQPGTSDRTSKDCVRGIEKVLDTWDCLYTSSQFLLYQLRGDHSCGLLVWSRHVNDNSLTICSCHSPRRKSWMICTSKCACWLLLATWQMLLHLFWGKSKWGVLQIRHACCFNLLQA